MNMQAIMQQAKKMQKEMTEAKDKIDKTIYEEKNEFVTVEAYGTKMIKSIKINIETLEHDDLEAIEDMTLLAINNVMKKIDADVESKLGKYTNGMPGLF